MTGSGHFGAPAPSGNLNTMNGTHTGWSWTG
jgi:hypothetical protein